MCLWVTFLGERYVKNIMITPNNRSLWSLPVACEHIKRTLWLIARGMNYLYASSWKVSAQNGHNSSLCDKIANLFPWSLRVTACLENPEIQRWPPYSNMAVTKGMLSITLHVLNQFELSWYQHFPLAVQEALKVQVKFDNGGFFFKMSVFP